MLPLIPYDDFEEALALANDSPFGLQAAIFTRDLGRVMRAWQVLDVGTVVVNHTTAVRVETLPFGGNKASGNGREGIHDTLHEMTKEKTLLLHEVFGLMPPSRRRAHRQELRRQPGGPGHLLRGRARPGAGALRRERRRQVDADEDAVRRDAARQRRDPARRQAGARSPARRTRWRSASAPSIRS